MLNEIPCSYSKLLYKLFVKSRVKVLLGYICSYTILPYGSALVQCIQQDVIKDLDITYDYSLYDMKGLKRKNPLAPSL